MSSSLRSVDGRSTQSGMRSRTMGTTTPTALSDWDGAVHSNFSVDVEDVSSLVGYFDRQVIDLEAEYNRRGAAIYKILHMSWTFQGTFILALFSAAFQMKGSIGCDVWLNKILQSALVLITLVAFATIAVSVHQFAEQSKLIELRRQIRQERNSRIDEWLRDETLTRRTRFMLRNYRSVVVFLDTKSADQWPSLTGGFILILICFSISVLFIGLPLLFFCGEVID